MNKNWYLVDIFVNPLKMKSAILLLLQVAALSQQTCCQIVEIPLSPQSMAPYSARDEKAVALSLENIFFSLMNFTYRACFLCLSIQPPPELLFDLDFAKSLDNIRHLLGEQIKAKVDKEIKATVYILRYFSCSFCAFKYDSPPSRFFSGPLFIPGTIY